MNSQIAVFIAILAACLATIAQVLLKKSAERVYKHMLYDFFNLRVFFAYAFMFGSILLNMQAMVLLPFKLVPVLGTLSYVFVIFIGITFFNEKLTMHKAIGFLFILTGIILFSTKELLT